MAETIPWNEFRPDVDDLDQALTQVILNCVPRADGYGPMQGLAGFTSGLPAVCRGYFCARNFTDSSVAIFAGTATKLYKLSNTTFTWTDVSKGAGSYSTLSGNANWSFAQFGNSLVAVQANAPPQTFNVPSDSVFSDLGGSPPQAAYVAVINEFLVLSGLLSNPNRVAWCGLNTITDWSFGDVNGADFQDLPDGGTVNGVVGAQNTGIVFQDAAIRQMVYAPGSAVIFDIYKLAKDIGCIAPYSICNDGTRILFLSQLGWVMTDFQGSINYVGKEKIDRTFLAAYDSANPQLVITSFDPMNAVFWIIYKSASSSVSYADSGLVYNWLLGRWAPFTTAMEYIGQAIKPGITLEALDAVASGNLTITGAVSNGGPNLIRLTVSPNTSSLTTGQTIAVSGVVGTTEANNTATKGWWTITVIDGSHIDLQGSVFTNAYVSGGIIGGSTDAMTASFDAYTTSISAALAGVDSNHTLGMFSGTNVQATFETAEMSRAAIDGQRILFLGARPITDATAVNMSIGYRETRNAIRSYKAAVAMDQYGFCADIQSARYARPQFVIPAGTTWTFCSGVQPECQGDGYA